MSAAEPAEAAALQAAFKAPEALATKARLAADHAAKHAAQNRAAKLVVGKKLGLRAAASQGQNRKK